MDDIISWLQSGKDYRQGVSLLAKYHKNRAFVRFFECSTPKRTLPKLEYELKKLLKNQPLTITRAKNRSTIIRSTLFGQPAVTQTTATAQNLPDIIKKAKDEIYDLYTRISIIHRQLYELGEGNSPEVVAQRKQMLQERLPLIHRYEKLYLLKEKYFETDKMDPELPQLLREKVEEDVPTAESKSNATIIQQISSLSDMDLLKKRQSLKVSLNKTRNRLEYQSLKKNDTPNPMPAGPLRTKLEAKLAALQQQLVHVNNLIKSRQ